METQQYVIKFKAGFSDLTEKLLTELNVLGFIESFGVYLVELTRSQCMKLKQEIFIKYVAQAA